MASNKRAAILGLVERAWGSAGGESPTEEAIKQKAGGHETRSGKSSGGSTKSPGRALSGGRKGPRKPAPAPPPRGRKP